MCLGYRAVIGLHRRQLGHDSRGSLPSATATIAESGQAAPDETEDGALNLNFMQGGGAQAAAFLSTANRYFPGRYWVDVQVNGEPVGKRVLTVTPQEQSALCLSPEWLADVQVYLRPAFYQSTYQAARQCYVLDEQANTQVVFDLATQTLNLAIPQAGLAKAGMLWIGSLVTVLCA